MKKGILYLFIFAIIGELMLRFDQKFKVMEDRKVVKISMNIETTPEYEMLKNNPQGFGQEDLKIMVLGDSYIHGGGIDFDDNFSQNLKRMINSDSKHFNNGWVLDVSKPNANNLDNNEVYFQYVNKFNPDIVILGYNLNDVSGNLQRTVNVSSNIESETNVIAGGQTTSLIGKIYDIIYTSEFIHFMLHEAHNQTKTLGYIIPGTKADLTIKSYTQNKENWIKSKLVLKEIIDDTVENDIQLIIYKFPEINLIENFSLFQESDKSIKDFFSEFPSVFYIDGSEQFKDKKSKEYRLSKYDGHPNEKAHQMMAEKTFYLIRKTNSKYNQVQEKYYE